MAKVRSLLILLSFSGLTLVLLVLPPSAHAGDSTLWTGDAQLSRSRGFGFVAFEQGADGMVNILILLIKKRLVAVEQSHGTRCELGARIAVDSYYSVARAASKATTFHVSGAHHIGHARRSLGAPPGWSTLPEDERP